MSPLARRPDSKILGSRLRQVTAGGPLVDGASDSDGSKSHKAALQAGTPSMTHFRHICNLSIHDAAMSNDDVLLNLGMGTLLSDSVAPGDLMQVKGIKSSAHDQYWLDGGSKHIGENEPKKHQVDDKMVDAHGAFLFRVVPMSSEMVSRYPEAELSVASQTAVAFHLVKGSQVLLSSVDESRCRASHVEIIFRDQYLARADMWRLVNAELANKCIHRGQKIVFMGTIKATVRSIFIRGRKAQSAVFYSTTKPIFRSESARYVLFIQMSKEMWDFDSEGTGEIMFDKVINGFLPELFKRWQQMQAKHLLSIILFSRMVYDDATNNSKDSATALADLGASKETSPLQTKDFYRVVVSDMPSGESADILNQLKKEFKVFLRDTSIRKPEPGEYNPIGSGLSGASSDLPAQIIAGHPSTAAHGNVLEAINLASSQFSSDYIDRDLVRTGVSIVVISAGTGLFEVEYDLLAATTDNLIDNGVGIDLVCLSRMPLHSVPLFQYKQPREESKRKVNRHKQKDGYTLPISNSLSQSYGTPSPSSISPSSYQNPSSPLFGWSYGIPHWIDISFWTPAEEQSQKVLKKLPKSKLKPEELHGPKHKAFIPRVKMYEIQMMGVMDNAEREICIPQLILGEGSASMSINQSPKSNSIAESKRIHELSGDSLDGETYRPAAGNVALSKSPSSIQLKQQAIGNVPIHRMDEYDESVFRNPRASRRRKVQRRPRNRSHAQSNSSLRPDHMTIRRSSLGTKQGSHSSDHSKTEANRERADQSRPSEQASDSKAPTGSQPARKISAMPRSISFGLKGLTPKTIATASATVDIAQPPTWTAKSSNTARNSVPEPNHRLSTLSVRQDTAAPSASSVRPFSDSESGIMPSSDSEHQDSRPIPIKSSRPSGAKRMAREGKNGMIDSRQAHVHDRVAALSDLRDADTLPANIEYEEIVQPLPPVLSPSTTLAPWLTILNPSNPSKTKLAETTRLGRWQHIFPRAPKTSQMKWKSLCSPAAIPLTTEEFPAADELEEEYKRSSYVINLPEEMDLSECPHSLVHELLAFRLSRGFQVVGGDRLTETEPVAAHHAENVFSEAILNGIGSCVLLSRGSAIHRMSRPSLDRLEIEVFTRHSVAAIDNKAEETPMLYTPVIRSMLAHTYEPQTISITPKRGSFNWDMIDSFIAGHERPQAAQYVETLRPWRARFVLIPVDPPSSARRMIRSSEDNEEEIRLEGIRKLTQLWQRFRFIPPEERGYQPQLRKGKDPNPLDISYQTKDPSAVILAELDSVLEGDETGRPVQLLPEPELYQRSNFNIKTLAETVQGEKGVRMLDRRWHWRLHYNCFIGFELTTWLLQNFRDVETREEAEDLGKDLMKNGLFKHVEHRHEFRDGNYFYQIEAEYRTPRPESKGWFGRGKTSVPATPMAEQPPSELPRNVRSRASSMNDSASEMTGSAHLEKKRQLSVALSKSLFYDMDHRKRSYRPELINLHYDRLHNPDNCYHIRVEWMNTTPRLIQEAVISWATNVERFGLRLVEVPIGEASSITSMHPFRAPYLVKLAIPPPAKQPPSFMDATTFTPQPNSEPLFYQKAMMKHFNFVLDFEAASSFPADVDVTYSWGKPDYRYPQYIHRSGVLIAQITDEGHFLLLANRLYNNRSSSNSETPSNLRDNQPDRNSPAFYRSSPHRGHHHHQSPYSSPAVRPTGIGTSSNLDVQSTPLRSHPTSSNTAPSQEPAPSNVAGASTRRPIPPSTSPSPPSSSSTSSPDHLTRAFQAFCSDPTALETFYASVLSKTTTPSSTPFLGAAKSSTATTPLRTVIESADTDLEPSLGGGVGEVDDGIPTLALPGRLLLSRGEGGGGKKAVELRGEVALTKEEKEGMKAEMMKAELRRLVGEGVRDGEEDGQEGGRRVEGGP